MAQTYFYLKLCVLDELLDFLGKLRAAETGYGLLLTLRPYKYSFVNNLPFYAAMQGIIIDILGEMGQGCGGVVYTPFHSCTPLNNELIRIL